MPDLRRQCFVIARLADYCDYRRGESSREDDPIHYLWGKLRELEEPMYQLKQDILTETIRAFFHKAKNDGVDEKDLVEFRHFLDQMVSRGDFADASFHLDERNLRDPERLRWAQDCIAHLKARQLLDEEQEAQHSHAWDKLVSELSERLELDLLEKVLRHKPLTRRRLAFILRRCRRNSYDYCGVFHLPLHPEDTFTPFIFPRVEALIAANRRFLRKIRRG